MIEFKIGKKSRNKKTLFNPYKNGITSYDLAYLSSKKSFYKNKVIHLQNDSKEEFYAS